MNRNRNKTFTIFLSIILVISMVSACGAAPAATPTTAASTTVAPQQTKEPVQTQNTETSTETPAGEPSKPLEISIFAPTANTMASRDKTRIELEIEKAVNAVFTYDGVPWGDYDTKLSLIGAAGTYSDLMYFTPSAVDTIAYGWYKDGVFSAMNNYLTEAPNLKKVFEYPLYKYLTYDGDSCFLPCICEAANVGWVYRKDWADKLGIKEPTTMDEFRELLRAFTEDDPDGNGKNDTWGMGTDPSAVAYLYGLLGYNGWQLNENGELTLSCLLKDYKSAMQFANNIFKAGYVFPEYFAEKTDQRYEKFVSGKYGVMFDNTGAHMLNRWQIPGSSVNPEYELGYFNPYPDAGNTLNKAGVGGTGGGFYGGLFVTSAVKDMKRLVGVFDQMYTPEMEKLRHWGIEGQSYTQNADGTITLNLEERIKDGFYGKDGLQYSDWASTGIFGSLPALWEGDKFIASKAAFYSFPKPEYNLICKESDEFANATVINSLSSGAFLNQTKETNDTYTKLIDIAKTYNTYFVTGEKDISKDWQEFENKLKEAGLESCTAAFSEALKKVGKIN
jgi:putative aldouronate transport system substrate-binding protein